MTRAGVIRMPMGDHGAIDRAQGIDMEAARFAIKPLRTDLQPMFGMG